jgi:hypothetical protein
MIQPNQNQLAIPNTSDSCIPGGAQIITLTNMIFDGTGTITYNFGQSGIAFRNPISIRSLYFDARTLTQDAIVSFGNGPTLRIPAGKQGYFQVFMPSPVNVSITSALGSGPLTVYLFNFKVAPFIW